MISPKFISFAKSITQECYEVQKIAFFMMLTLQL